LGMLSVIGASTATMELSHRKRKWPLYIYIGMALAVLILTGSRSSLIGFVLTITYFVNQSDNKKMKTLIYVGMIAAMPAALTTIIFKQGDVEEVLSMTGRLLLYYQKGCH
jgi:exopolysaccharide production protein ExoQ